MTEFGSARRATPELCRDAGRRALSNRYQIGRALFEVIQAVLRTEIARVIAREELQAVPSKPQFTSII
jgi:hypothetical protein